MNKLSCILFSIQPKGSIGMHRVILPFFSQACALLALICIQVHAQNPDTEITEHYKRMMTYHRYMDGNIPEGAVLFIGDSITQGLCTVAVWECSVNYGIGSDTTVGVLQRLPDYSSMSRAGAVVVAIGVNDLARRDNAEILVNYKKIMENIPQHTLLLFSAVLPLDERDKDVKEDRNPRIRELNKSLADLCKADSRCSFLDSTPALADDTGNLNPSYHVGDGVHLNTEGYVIWIKALREHLKSIIPSQTNPLLECVGQQK